MKERSLYLDVVNALESVGVLATAYAAYAVLKRYSLTRLLFLGGR